MDMNLAEKIAVSSNKIIYRDGNKIIKLFGANYSDADPLCEAFNLACVGESGIHTPKLLEVTKVDGRWALVMEYIEGETLGALMEKDAGNFAKYLERFVEIQIAMHNHKAPRLRSIVEKMHGKISASGLEATLRYELHTRLNSLPAFNHLCHGDYCPSNVVITTNNEYAILDWMHATQGSDAADVARTYLLFHLSGRVEIANQYLDSFCKKSGIEKQQIQKWIPIVSASRLVKCQPPERDLLSRWASVVEYQ